jgi:hypothetical protein
MSRKYDESKAEVSWEAQAKIMKQNSNINTRRIRNRKRQEERETWKKNM